MLARAVAFVACVVSVDAVAAEVQFEGFYQMRGRLFDTLSLTRDSDADEGLSWYVQHRLWLRPKFLITDKVGLFAEIRALDNMYWGNTPASDFPGLDPVFSDNLQALSVAADGRSAPDISLWRAWGEVHTKFGTFRFGRMPIHWGLGIWQNDGLGLNMDYGDSADRLSWEHLIQNVWVRVAADINTEGLINETDDTTSFNVAAAYRTERMDGGLQFQYRRRSQEESKFDLFTVDGAFDLQFGPIDLAGEVIGQFGGGDQSDGINDVKLASVGAVIDAQLSLDKLRAGVEAGLASGDGELGDTKVRTFQFDPDYNVGFMLFEQAMPVLQEAVATEEGAGRDLDHVLLGNGVSNALFLRPRFSYEVFRGLWADGSFLAARTAKVPEEVKALGRQGYGYEIDLGLRYEGIEHFFISGTFGTFIPGGYFKRYEDPDFGTIFSAPVFGGQLTGRVEF